MILAAPLVVVVFLIGSDAWRLHGASEPLPVRVITQSIALPKESLLVAHWVVRGSHLVIDGDGGTLMGGGNPADPASMEKAGVGITLEGCVDVTIRNVKVRGFAIGIHAKGCRGLRLENADVSGNYDNPKHGWGELPARGGILFEQTHESLISRCQGNRNWDGVHLIDSDDNQVEDCDFSHCSNTCAKLWHSSRNRFSRNDLSFGIRIDRAAGEVHARDSSGVLIETGSDQNIWLRNNITHGGDGIFIRVLNGWVSRGNLFVENDTSHANNNCIESWSPGNTYLRNIANYGSYGFWLGGSDQTVLIGNEAAYNGLATGNHNAPEPGFGHGGIVFVSGSSSHCLLSGNHCHHNNGGGIVFRGDAGSQGKRWSTFHWVVQENRLEENRWPIWGRWGDWIWASANTSSANTNLVLDTTHWIEPATVPGVLPPAIQLFAPTRASVGVPVVFDASGSHDPQGRPLAFRWDLGGSVHDQKRFSHTFDKPGFYRVGLTVDNGAHASIGWRDLVVSESVQQEIGTEGPASRWGFELEGNGDGRGRMVFEEDSDAIVGKNAIRFTPNPYPGQYATALFPSSQDANLAVEEGQSIRFWIKTANPNLPGFQNAGPVLLLICKDGTVKLEPAKSGNIFGELPYSEARWTWMRMEIPVAGDKRWTRHETGHPDLQHVQAVGLALDSWGGDPFTVWIDGMEIR